MLHHQTPNRQIHEFDDGVEYDMTKYSLKFDKIILHYLRNENRMEKYRN